MGEGDGEVEGIMLGVALAGILVVGTVSRADGILLSTGVVEL